jgi:hypothetical protein
MPSARGFLVCPPTQAGNSQARVEPKDSDSWHLLKALVGSMFVDGKTSATIACSTCRYVLQNSFVCYGREIHDCQDEGRGVTQVLGSGRGTEDTTRAGTLVVEEGGLREVSIRAGTLFESRQVIGERQGGLEPLDCCASGRQGCCVGETFPLQAQPIYTEDPRSFRFRGRVMSTYEWGKRTMSVEIRVRQKTRSTDNRDNAQHVHMLRGHGAGHMIEARTTAVFYSGTLTRRRHLHAEGQARLAGL